MGLGYLTEEQISERARAAFSARIAEETRLLQELEERGEDVARHKRRFPIHAIGSPEYLRWVADRIKDARDRGLLVTAQQLNDVRARRRLLLGDRAKYVGLSRIETTRSGRSYNRMPGETGTISKAVLGSDQRYVYTFTPTIPPGALDKHGPHVFIAELIFREGTPGYFTIERIPESTQDARPAQERA